MGWRLWLVLGVLTTTAGLFACSGGCGDAIRYASAVEAGATSCVVTLTNANASLSIAVGDMPADAGCAANDPMFGVSCTSAQISSKLVCLRACSSFNIVGDGVAAARARTVLGVDGGSVTASVACDGATVPSAPKQAFLRECAM